MAFLKQYFFFLLGIFVLSGVFAFGNVSFAASCTFNDSSTGKSYSGECRSNAAGCGTNELSKDDSTGACSAAGVGLWDCCVPNTTTFYCGTGGEGTCKDACASGDTAVSGSDSQCASLTVTKGKCCKAASSTGASCSGKDSSGATQSGTCSTTATCSSGTALTSATGCSSGMACCFSSTGSGTGTSTGSSCTGSQNAGIVPCGRSCDNPATTDVDESAICTLCHLFLLMKNITSWIFMVMTYIAFAVLVAMGVLYIVSAGNTQMIGLAKSGIKAALYGFAIVLLGWVAINVILMVLADGALGTDTATFSFKTNGSWFTYSCDAKSKYVRTGISGVTGGGGNSSGGGNTGSLSCTSGACAKDSAISSAVKSQSYIDSNMYMAVLQAGEHYNQNTSCSKGVSGKGACGYSQAIPSTASAICGLTCSEIIADVNKDIGCGAKILADFKKYSMCNLDGIKSLSGCYNSGTSNCTPNSRTVNGKCYSCGEGTPPYCDRVSAYYEACK